MDFAVLGDHKVKIRESEKTDKYQDLSRELKKKKKKKRKRNKRKNTSSQKTNKLWNMWVVMIPIVVSAIGTVPKELERRLEQLEHCIVKID